MTSKIFAAALFALLTVTAPAKAALITWDVNAVSISGIPGTPPANTWTVTGSFVFNSALQTITDFNISATGFPDTTPFTLNPSDAQASIGTNFPLSPPETGIGFTQNGAPPQNYVGLSVNGLILPQLAEPNPTGIPLIIYSSVGFNTGSDTDSSFFLGGSLVSATPLPDALPMFGAALLAFMGFGAWRSRRA
jgi:hypothetical protein